MRPDWLQQTAAVVSALCDELVVADTDDFMAIVRRSIEIIEIPPDVLQRNTLRLMLLDVCRTIVITTHVRHPSPSCFCHAVAWQHMPPFVALDSDDPRNLLAQWAEIFLTHVAAQHPSTSAQRAAALIRAEPHKGWTLRALAIHIDVPQNRLSREFVKTLGVRPAEYVHLVRVAVAVGLFRTGSKVEAIAGDVGYRSKKDFYAALRRWTGRTPTELRELPEEESAWLARELRRRSLQHDGARQPMSQHQAFANDGVL